MEIRIPVKVTVCYPEDARPADGFVSVLSQPEAHAQEGV